MTEPTPIPFPPDEAGEQADEGPGEQSLAAPIIVQKNAAVVWLVAAAAAGSLITATAMIVTGYSRSQEEISGLEKTIGKLTEEKHDALQQLDDLRNSHYAQVIAERRCEVIDGLEDCLKAGLKRPPHFAESDRQYLEARRSEGSKADKPAGAANATRTAAGTGSLQGGPAPRAAGKLSLDEFAQTLGKIPGVAVDGGAVERPERKAGPGKAVGNPGKPGAE